MQFTLSRTGDVSNTLSVAVSWDSSSGLVSNDLLSQTTVTFAKNARTTTVSAATIDDETFNETERLALSLSPVPASTNATPVYRVGQPNSAEVEIADNDPLPVVTVAATVPEGGYAEGDTVQFTLSRTEGVSDELLVKVSWQASGEGVVPDAILRQTSLTFARSQRNLTLLLNTLNNDIHSGGPRILALLLWPVVPVDSNGIPSYRIGSPDYAEVQLADDDPVPVVTLELTPSTIDESGGTSTVTAVLDRPSTLPTHMDVSVEAGAPVRLSSNRLLTIPSEQTESTSLLMPVTLTARDNDVDAPDEDVSVMASARNSNGIVGPEPVTLTITDDDETPTSSDGEVKPNEDEAYAFKATDFSFDDGDGDTLAGVRITTLPTPGTGVLALADMAVLANDFIEKTAIDAGQFIYTPPADANGDDFASFKFRVNDGTQDSVDEYTMTINITPVNDAPAVQIEIADQTATAGREFNFTFPGDAFGDVDGDTLTYEATKGDGNDLPDWLAFNAGTRTFTGTPAAGAVGTLAVMVTASDGTLSASDKFDIVVGEAPADTTAPTVESIVRQDPAASPTNADALTWRVTFSEDVANVDQADFTVTGTTATLAVTEVTAAKVYAVTASDGDLAGLDGTVTLGFAPGQDITDTADTPNALTDTASAGTDQRTYNVDNTAPTVTITDVPGTSDAPFRATFAFSEAVTGFTVEDIAVGNGTASNFTGSDGATTYTAVITPAADGEVTVNVVADAAEDEAGNLSAAGTAATSTYYSNTPPIAQNNTVTATEDTPYTFKKADFEFADADAGDMLDSVRIVTLPAAGTGELKLDDVPVTRGQAVSQNDIDLNLLTYTPPANAHGTGYARFTFKVSDGTHESASAYTMTIDVDAVNDAPTLANPIANQQATAGVPFSFTVPTDVFEDADGDPLDYHATLPDDNPLPAWLAFNDVTRTFEGTPGSGDTGTLTVKVSVSDGGGEASDEFDIVVAAGADAACPAPNFGTRRQIWTGTVTVGSFTAGGSAFYGFGSDGGGALDDATFGIGTHAYTIDDLSVRSGGSGDGELQFSLSEDGLTDREAAALRVHACNAPYDFSAASFLPGPLTYVWSAGLDWSGETTRRVYLSLPANRAATGTPTIASDGAAVSGDTLTAHPGSIADADGLPDTFAYQWIREDADGANAAPIAGETAETYTLTNADVGKRVRVRVGFTDLLGGAETRASGPWPSSGAVAEDPANPVRPNTPASGAPTISGPAGGGAPRVGDTLTADIGAIEDADGLPPAAGFGYQWFRQDADGSNREDIPGANGPSYTLAPGDAGKAVGVRVTFTDEGGAAETLTSAPTAVVAARATSDALPGIVADARTVTITHDEALDPASAPALGDFEVRITRVDETNREWTVIASLAAVRVSGSTVTLRLDNRLHHEDVVRVDYTPGASPLRYAGGGDAPGFADAAAENRTPDIEPPRVLRRDQPIVNGATLRITFSEPLDPGSVPAPEGFEVNTSFNVHRHEGILVQRVAVSGRVVTLTLARAVGGEESVSVSYGLHGGIPIRDLAGNPSWTGGQFGVDNRTPAGTAQGKTLTADGDTVTVVFGAALDAATAPGLYDFKVKTTRTSSYGYLTKKLRTDTTLANIRTVTVSGSTVTLTLYNPMDHETTVRLSYVQGDSPLRFSDGTAVAAFSNLPVENLTAEEREEPSPPPIVVSVADARVREGPGATLDFVVSLSRPAPPPGLLLVHFRLDNGSAVIGEDYLGVSGSAYIQPGETSTTISVSVVEDDRDEGNETMTLTIFDPSEGRIGVGTATGTIVDSEQNSAEEEPLTAAQQQSDEEESPTEEEPPAEPPPIVVSVSDARVREGPGATLDFVVSLSRPAPPGRLLLVPFRTRDGTAKTGEDYVAFGGRTYIRPGETGTTISVKVLDDNHDEGNETMTLTISDPSEGRIGVGTATGTIVNSDPMPKAWLARFGRTASDHAVEAIENRIGQSDGPPPASHLTVGGRRVDTLLDWERLRAPWQKLRGDTDGGPAPADPRLQPEHRWARMDRLRAEMQDPALAPIGSTPPSHGPAVGVAHAGAPHAGVAHGSVAHGSPSAPHSGSAEGGAGAAARLRGALTQLLGLEGLSQLSELSGREDPLLGSSFFYSRPGDGDDAGWLGHWSAWGQTAATRFGGADGPLTVDGEVATATLGFDTTGDRLTAGVALAYSEGEGAYTGETAASGGAVSSRLASLHPFARYRIGERASVWGVLGYGAGGLSLTPERAEAAIETDMNTSMAAFGGRGVLSVRAAGAGQLEFALRSDARFTRAESGAVQTLAGAVGDTARVRLALEGRGSFPLSGGAVLTPTLEAGLRYDDGDAETGAGLELGGGLAFRAGRFSVQFKARGLAAHRDAAYEEWGASAALAWTPRADGLGLNASLGSSWGVAESGVNALWNREHASDPVPGGAAFSPGQRFEAALGYGLEGRRGRALWQPYLSGGSAGDGAGTLRLGLRMTSGAHAEANLEIGLRERDGAFEGGRAADARAPSPDAALKLTGSIRW